MDHRRRSASTPADIVTYRLENKMVYVTPARNYEEAIDFALREFPEELCNISRDRLSFSISVYVKGELRSVRIGRMAWHTVVATLQRYEIIEILVQPQLCVQDMDAPPRYPLADSKEATEFYQSRQESRSCPPSRGESRHSSPSASVHSTSSETRRARSWFGKHF